MGVMKPSVQEWQSSFRAVRKDGAALSRPRIGRTRLMHDPLLRGEPAPAYSLCGVPLTVAYVLVDCFLYAEGRRFCLFDCVIFDIFGDNPCRASNVLQSGSSQPTNGCFLRRFRVFIYFTSSVFCRMQCTLPGPFTAWQILVLLEPLFWWTRFLLCFRISVPFMPYWSRLRHFTFPGFFTIWYI
jgi:hypothetical protein